MAKTRRSAARPAPAKASQVGRPVEEGAGASCGEEDGEARGQARSRPSRWPKSATGYRGKSPARAAKRRAPPRPARQARWQARQAPPPPQRSTYADAVSLYERGMQALQAKRYREAAETLKAVIARFPEEKELHERAQLYIRVCERQMTPLDATPKTPEERVYAATLAINAGQVDRAIALLTAALQQDPENDPGRVHARRGLLAQGRSGRRAGAHHAGARAEPRQPRTGAQGARSGGRAPDGRDPRRSSPRRPSRRRGRSGRRRDVDDRGRSARGAAGRRRHDARSRHDVHRRGRGDRRRHHPPSRRHAGGPHADRRRTAASAPGSASPIPRSATTSSSTTPASSSSPSSTTAGGSGRSRTCARART